MSRGQMLRGQMSPWQLESVLNIHRKLPLKFHQNRVSNSWDIADIDFLWWWWWGVQSHFVVKPNLVLRLGWGFDNTGILHATHTEIFFWWGGQKCPWGTQNLWWRDRPWWGASPWWERGPPILDSPVCHVMPGFQFTGGMPGFQFTEGDAVRFHHDNRME